MTTNPNTTGSESSSSMSVGDAAGEGGSLLLPGVHQEHEMRYGLKTVYDLLESVPDEQIKRCQLAYRATLGGEWADAVVHLRQAALEAGGQWAEDARALADYLDGKIRT